MRHSLIKMIMTTVALAGSATQASDRFDLWSLYFDVGGGTAGGEAAGLYGAQLRARFDEFQVGLTYDSGFALDADLDIVSLLVGYGAGSELSGLHFNLLGELGHQSLSDGVDFFGDSRAGSESTFLGLRAGFDIRMSLEDDTRYRDDSGLHFVLGLETFMRLGLDGGDFDLGLLLYLGLGLAI